ncbi:MAG: 3-dehydroquinate synthase [Candidatus Deferrimicrobium sp.]
MNPETMTVALGDRSYDIFFGRGIYSLFQEWICRFYPGGSVHVVTDRNVAAIYGDDIRRWLAGIPHDVLALPPGEEHKNFDTVREIYGFLARGDAGRDSLVVAFGGGVVGDLAGFAAATYLRGISCIQVPTTLLSQVDSSVGGKTGFNLPEGKNLVGAFHQPRAVFIDDAFLLTLDDRNLRAGMAEVVKCALAGDAELWDRLLEVVGKWKALSGEEWRWVVRRAVAFKASVVEKDERETSLRRILNLGHTIGHAMEKSGGFGRLLHGEAVAMGLAWEAILGMKLGVTGEEIVDDLVSLLIGMGFPLDDPGVALTSIAAAIGMDKKRMASDVDLPLIAAPGRCELRRVPLAEVRRELPGIRAEIRERSIARDLNVPAGNAIPEESPVSNLVRVGDEVYEIRSAEGNVSPSVPAESGPGDGPERAIAAEPEPEHAGGPTGPEPEHAVAVAPGPEQAVAVEPAPEHAPSEPPAAPTVRTVTLADLYWSQGEHSTARRIIGEILRDDPANLRALAWLTARKGDDLVEADLLWFLETMAKEYGYDLS